MGRNHLYVTHKAGKEIIAFDLDTGEEVGLVKSDYQTDSLAQTPDGTRLFAALLAGEHGSGFIAEIDLTTLEKVKEFEITVNPYDLVATDSGFTLVSSASGQWTEIHAYKVSTGEKVGSAGIRHRSHLALHPSQRFIYAADTDVSPSDIGKLALDEDTEKLTGLGDSPYHGDHLMSGNVFAHPAGDRVITRGGGIYTSSPEKSQDMRYMGMMQDACEEVAFGPPISLLLRLIRNAPSVAVHDLDSLEESEPVDLGIPPDFSQRFVGISERSAYALSSDTDSTLVARFQLIPEIRFIRGDIHIDHQLDIADPIWLISELFFGGPLSTCLEAGDLNLDGQRDISDAIFMIGYCFLGVASPPPAVPRLRPSARSDRA